MIGVLILAGWIVFGFALLRLVGVRMERMEKAVVAPVVGLVTGGWLMYLVAERFGSLGGATVATTLAIFFVVAVAARFRPGSSHGTLPRWFIVLAGSSVVVLCTFNLFAVLASSGGNLLATEHVWSDTPFHSSLITMFAYRDVYPPSYPIALGEPLNYPFLVDFLSGALLRYGMGLRASVVVINVLLHVAFFLGVALIVRRISGSARASVLAVVVLFMLGNLGWLTIASDVSEAGGLGAWLGDLPWSYTGDSAGIGSRERLGVGIYLANPMFIHLLPRRSAAFGMAAGAVLLLLLDDVVRHRRAPTAVVAGLVAGVLPRVHAHTAIAMAIVGATWVAYEAIARRSDGWPGLRSLTGAVGIAGFVAVAIGLPEVIQLREHTEQYFAFWPGWIGENREAFADAGSGIADIVGSTVAFWVLNAGALFVLIPLTLWRGGSAIRRWYLPFIGIWLLGFLIRTQPWEWDNNNHFIWWQVGSVIAVAPLLVSWLHRSSPLYSVMAGVLVASLCLGGILTFLFAGEHRMHLWTAGDQAFARKVRLETPRDAIILTSNGHSHPVTGLSGRQVVMGFTGWLSTRGLDWARFEDDVVSMLSGDVRRMRRLGVDYVVIGPWEIGLAEEKNFEIADVFTDRRRFEVVLDETFEGREWRLLKLTG